MKDNSGILVCYDAKDGTRQMAVMKYKDQLPELKIWNRALLTLVDDDLEEIEKDGKVVKSVKKLDLLTQIGMVD